MTSLELNADNAKALSELANRWSMSEEEALKKALELASQSKDEPVRIHERLAAFREFQAALNMDREKAETWKSAIRDARR